MRNSEVFKVIMGIYFTADMHLGHEGVIKYCSRPFKDVVHMDEVFTDKWNDIVTYTDIVYHLGDFCFYKRNAYTLEQQFAGKIIHVLGNHDKNNGVKERVLTATMQFGGEKIYLVHNPDHIKDIPKDCKLVLCGHVHKCWKFKITGDIVFINVGVDVWDFKPVSMKAILKFRDRIRSGKEGVGNDETEKK